MNLEPSEERSGIIPTTFMCLKQYPNKNLLSHSKIHHFQDNKSMFEPRCLLFTELCYLLISSQQQNREVLHSKNMFLNHHKCLFMLFSFDRKYKDRFKTIERGKIVENIRQLYQFIFPSELHQDIDDDEENQISNNIKQTIDKLNDIIPEEGKDREYLQTIKGLLERSELFQQYAYDLKWNMAVLIKAIILPREEKDQILQTYSQLLEIQINLQRLLSYRSQNQGMAEWHVQYYRRLFHIFKLLQTRNYLKIMTTEEESVKTQQKSSNIIIFTIDFNSNPRRQDFINKTLHESSSEQSSVNFNEEEKDNIPNRLKEYTETLYISKNSIRFRIKIQFKSKDNTFGIEVEGESHWVLQEFYYDLLSNLWGEFLNLWYNTVLEHNSYVNGKQHRQFKWELTQRQKCPAIRQKFQVQPSSNLTKQILISVDRIVMVLLLYENTLKYLFKVSQNMLEYDQRHIRHLQDRNFVQTLVARFRHSIGQYEQYENTLREIERALWHK